MAQTTSSVINRFSTLASDPLRSFRFYVEFTKIGNDDVFDNRIVTGSATKPFEKGVSTGFIGGFSQITGLSTTTQSIPYREGGYNTTVHQVPGMTSFVPVTFQRGVLYGNDQAMTWMRGLFGAASGEGLSMRTATAAKNFRVNVNIYVMDHPNANGTGAGVGADGNIPRMGFKLYNAWITTLNYSDLNAADGAILYESMTLVHEGLSVFFTDDKYNRKDGVKK
jgi:phage tail-like protein